MSTICRFGLMVFVVMISFVNTGKIAFSATIADSEAEFSGTQGTNNWFYGYYDGDTTRPFTNDPMDDDFEQLTMFENNTWSLAVGAGGYWTFLWKSGGHPNGTIGTSGRLPVVHWASRRWVSDVSGEVNISGRLAKRDPGGGNGVTGHIFIDGVEIFSQHIAYNDIVGVDYSVNATVYVGSLIDFVIDPEINQRFDSTIFTAKIETKYPEDNTIPDGFVKAYDNIIWPPNNKMVPVTLEGNVLDALSINRDGGGVGVSSAYLYIMPGGKLIPLRNETTDILDQNGEFNVMIEVKAVKCAIYTVELYAADTVPENAGGPNGGFVDSTSISVPHDMGQGRCQ